MGLEGCTSDCRLAATRFLVVGLEALGNFFPLEGIYTLGELVRFHGRVGVD